MEAEGVFDLALALQENQGLDTLTLWGNNFGKAGMKVLAKMLGTNKVISSLDVRGNTIQNEGVASLADAIELTKNRTLSFLDLTGNNVDHHGAAALANVLSTDEQN